MVRVWKELAGESLSGSDAFVYLFVALLMSLALISAVLLGCADGASKEKASASHTDTYGGTACAAGCGGGGCGA